MLLTHGNIRTEDSIKWNLSGLWQLGIITIQTVHSNGNLHRIVKSTVFFLIIGLSTCSALSISVEDMRLPSNHGVVSLSHFLPGADPGGGEAVACLNPCSASRALVSVAGLTRSKLITAISVSASCEPVKYLYMNAIHLPCQQRRSGDALTNISP